MLHLQTSLDTGGVASLDAYRASVRAFEGVGVMSEGIWQPRYAAPTSQAGTSAPSQRFKPRLL